MKKTTRPNLNTTIIQIGINKQSIYALVDIGATSCFANPSFPVKWNTLEHPLTVSVADDRKVQSTKAAYITYIQIQGM